MLKMNASIKYIEWNNVTTQMLSFYKLFVGRWAIFDNFYSRLTPGVPKIAVISTMSTNYHWLPSCWGLQRCNRIPINRNAMPYSYWFKGANNDIRGLQKGCGPWVSSGHQIGPQSMSSLDYILLISRELKPAQKLSIIPLFNIILL